jgi:hypothetical protein
MDFPSICVFLAMKRLLAHDVHNELVSVLGLNAIPDSIPTKYRRWRRFTTISSEYPDEPSRSIINDTILETLDNQPFSSLQELAKLTCVPSQTVDRHLIRSLGLAVKHPC